MKKSKSQLSGHFTLQETDILEMLAMLIFAFFVALKRNLFCVLLFMW